MLSQFGSECVVTDARENNQLKRKEIIPMNTLHHITHRAAHDMQISMNHRDAHQEMLDQLPRRRCQLFSRRQRARWMGVRQPRARLALIRLALVTVVIIPTASLVRSPGVDAMVTRDPSVVDDRFYSENYYKIVETRCPRAQRLALRVVDGVTYQCTDQEGLGTFESTMISPKGAPRGRWKWRVVDYFDANGPTKSRPKGAIIDNGFVLDDGTRVSGNPDTWQVKPTDDQFRAFQQKTFAACKSQSKWPENCKPVEDVADYWPQMGVRECGRMQNGKGWIRQWFLYENGVTWVSPYNFEAWRQRIGESGSAWLVASPGQKDPYGNHAKYDLMLSGVSSQVGIYIDAVSRFVPEQDGDDYESYWAAMDEFQEKSGIDKIVIQFDPPIVTCLTGGTGRDDARVWVQPWKGS